MKPLAIALALLTSGCCTDLARTYNHDDEQDRECYNRYGGKWGYCDSTLGGAPK